MAEISSPSFNQTPCLEVLRGKDATQAYHSGLPIPGEGTRDPHLRLGRALFRRVGWVVRCVLLVWESSGLGLAMRRNLRIFKGNAGGIQQRT